MRERYFAAEVWNLFESACIYHRQAHRCFQNLRVHSIVSRNAKKTKYMYRDGLLRKCLHAFMRWATRGIHEGQDDVENGMQGSVLVSRAEELAFVVRTKRMEKLKKRRDVAKAYKERDTSRREAEIEKERAIELEILSSKDVSISDAGPRARQRRLSMEFRRINAAVKAMSTADKADTAFSMIKSLDTISSDGGSDASVRDASSFNLDPLSITTGIPFSVSTLGGPEEPQKLETCGKDTMDQQLGSPVTVMSTNESVPGEDYDLDNIDMLEWDRQERDEEMDLMQAMVKLGKEVASETRKKVRQVAREAAKVSTINVSYLGGAVNESNHNGVHLQVTRDNLLNEVFERENQRNEYSIRKEFQYVDTFKIRMASNMVDVIAKVNIYQCCVAPFDHSVSRCMESYC